MKYRVIALSIVFVLSIAVSANAQADAPLPRVPPPVSSEYRLSLELLQEMLSDIDAVWLPYRLAPDLPPSYFDESGGHQLPYLGSFEIDDWIEDQVWRVPSDSKIEAAFQEICKKDPRPRTASLRAAYAGGFEMSVTLTYETNEARAWFKS